MSVELGRLEEDRQPLDEGFVGFRLGIRGYFRDYRDSAVRGDGLNAGIASDGRLFIGELPASAPRLAAPPAGVRLRLRARPAGPNYRVDLAALDASGKSLADVSREVPAEWLAGGVALVCSSGRVLPSPRKSGINPDFGAKPGTGRGGTLRFWFRDWRVAGSKVTAHEDRAFGPILFALHTLSRRVLKLTAQMAPVDDPAAQVELQGRRGNRWETVGRSPVDPLSRTATFRVPNWDDSRDTPYRVAYQSRYFFEGAIRKDPKQKPQIVVAAFTGNNDLGFPHADIVRNVRHFQPDLLFFTGDNIYERVGEYGIQRAPLETAALDYLRKWYLFGWEYRDLLREIPAVCLPDDHDVYHGNVWGAGGRRAEGSGNQGQDQGGYTMPAPWVNAVQRTQTSHLPDPYDPTPVEQGITVYYSQLLYGGLSTAIVEDRKWKSAPKQMLPKADIINGWPQNPAYDAAEDGDAPGAQLLGKRQEDFLNAWAADWSGGAWMKTVVSQTIFADVATLPRGANTDAITPKLKVMQPGEYPQGEAPVMDHDSNGWPQTPRNTALRAMRRALAFHIAGDQHLGSTVQYGIDQWNDAGWAICVPSVANIFPRRWYPTEPGRNRKPGSPRNTGEFLDGFGNKITVHAVSNPTAVGVEPSALHDRAPGYGIVTFDRASRKITIANWPRWVDAARPGAKPYEGWPITIHQHDNGLPNTGWALAAVNEPSLRDPVVQVIDQSSSEIVYTLRIQGSRFLPRVFREGTYTVKVMDPDRGVEKVYRDRRATRQ
jgi:phosphodiesterase/alkaline phosphatase D-like protein